MHGPNGGAAAIRCLTVLFMGVALLTLLTLLGRLSVAASWVAVLVLPVLGLVVYLIGYTWSKGQQAQAGAKLVGWLRPIIGERLAVQFAQYLFPESVICSGTEACP